MKINVFRFDYQRLFKKKKIQNNLKVEKGSQETNPLKSVEAWQMFLIKSGDLITFKLSKKSEKRAGKLFFFFFRFGFLTLLHHLLWLEASVFQDLYVGYFLYTLQVYSVGLNLGA